MKKDLKVGDIVEYWGMDFGPLKFWEKLYLYPKWWFKDFFYWCKKRYQKVRYGFVLEESWDFRSYCVEWSLPRLKHFRANLHGHPSILVDDVECPEISRQQYFAFMSEMQVKPTAHEKWEQILDKIIWSMENCDNAPDPIYPPDYQHKQIVVSVEDRGIAFKNLDDRPIDFSNVEAHEKKVQEGFYLFGKYFLNLWD